MWQPVHGTGWALWRTSLEATGAPYGFGNLRVAAQDDAIVDLCLGPLTQLAAQPRGPAPGAGTAPGTAGGPVSTFPANGLGMPPVGAGGVKQHCQIGPLIFLPAVIVSGFHAQFLSTREYFFSLTPAKMCSITHMCSHPSPLY